MADLVPLTNDVAALMIVSAMLGFGGDDAILDGAPASAADASAASAAVQANAATEATAMNAQAAPATQSAAEAKAALPANNRSREPHSARWLLAAV